jgi:hypothetical protein
LLQGLDLGVRRLCAGSGGAGLPLHLVQLVQQALQQGEGRGCSKGRGKEQVAVDTEKR